VNGKLAEELVFPDERGRPLVTPTTHDNSWFDLRSSLRAFHP
jgi:hypothetical protein